jgi:hypothetical protein
MVDRKPLITGLESLLDGSLVYAQNLLDYQKLKQNDARVTFFKHVNVVLDSATTSIILAHKHLGEMDWWKDAQREYNRSDNRRYDYEKQFRYYDQTVMNGYFLFIFSSFEASVRLICKQYNPQLFEEQKSSISAISKGITSDLHLKKRDKFIDLITLLRNSFHNNGIFVPGGNQLNRKIIWNNTTYFFNENQPIRESKSEMWLSFVPISSEIVDFYKDIINSVPIKKISYIPDPSEQIR